MSNVADIRELRVLASEYQKKMGKSNVYSKERDEVQSIYAPSRHDAVTDLFEFCYSLPEYQREYTWTPEKEINQFLETVYNGICQIDKGNYVYPLGNMILLKERLRDDNGNDYIKKSLIDGQQRFTTEMATLLVIRYLLLDMPKISKEVNGRVEAYVKKITKALMHSMIDDSDNVVHSYVLNCPTRLDYDKFLKNLISDNEFVKTVVENPTKFSNTKKDSSKDISISNLTLGMVSIKNYLYRSTYGLADDDKISLIEYYFSFADYIFKNLMHGIVELTNPEKARRAYYQNNFTGQHLSEYEGFKYMVITEMPEDKHVEYSKLWDELKSFYHAFANTKTKDSSGGMGFLTLARSNFKAKYTKLKGGHGSSTELVVYNAVKDTVVRDKIDFMADCARLDYYFKSIFNYKNNPKMSEASKRNIHWMRMTSTTYKWTSVLVAVFDIMGEEKAYFVMDKCSEILHKFIGFLMTGRDTVNVSVFDDNLDSIVCELYRRGIDSPYLNEQDFLTTFESVVKSYYKTKNGTPIDRRTFKAAWSMTCTNKSVCKGVSYLYEYMYDPAGFYYRFNDDNKVEHCSLMGKFASEVNTEYYNMAFNSRWSYAFFDYMELYKSDIFKSRRYTTIDEFNQLVGTALQKVSPATTRLWMNTVGLDNSSDKANSFKLYGEQMCEAIMDYLGIPQ